MRANRGMPPTPTAIATFSRPGPRMVTMMSARRIPGNASSTSTSRMSARSTQPPRIPATSPTRPPDTIAIATAAKPIESDARPPSMSRSKTSRPNWSVPSG